MKKQGRAVRKGVINHASSVCWSGLVMIIELVGLQLRGDTHVLRVVCCKSGSGRQGSPQCTVTKRLLIELAVCLCVNQAHSCSFHFGLAVVLSL
jgi:hypothetical protein